MHLIKALKQVYTVTVDWAGSMYCGTTLTWNYKEMYVDLSMPKYIEQVLHKYQHPKPSKPKNSPYKCIRPIYRKQPQMAVTTDDLPILPPKSIKRIQQITGSLLYYSRMIDSTILVALNTITTQKLGATQKTQQDIHWLLYYCNTHPSATIRYYASDMILKIHSDTSYLNEPEAKSRYGGHFYLSQLPLKQSTDNVTVLNTASIIKNVVSSAAEAEYGALFLNARTAIPTKQTLEEMGHNQIETPICTDNATACGIANKAVKLKQSRAMDMRFHWIRDRTAQKQYLIYWEPGQVNKADYFTTNHPVKHHKQILAVYIHDPQKDIRSRVY